MMVNTERGEVFLNFNQIRRVIVEGDDGLKVVFNGQKDTSGEVEHVFRDKKAVASLLGEVRKCSRFIQLGAGKKDDLREYVDFDFVQMVFFERSSSGSSPDKASVQFLDGTRREYSGDYARQIEFYVTYPGYHVDSVE